MFFGCRSIGDWSATTIPKNRLPVGDRSATGGRLIANWLEIGCDWSATGWRLVGDRSAMSWRLTIEQTICCVGVIMNKALINCYSMAISISIMSYCLFLGYFLVRIYIDCDRIFQTRQSIIKFERNIKVVIFKSILVIGVWTISFKIAFMKLPLD